jgi:hypothetical protein
MIVVERRQHHHYSSQRLKDLLRFSNHRSNNYNNVKTKVIWLRPMPRMIRQSHRDYYEIVKQILQNVYANDGGCKPSELAYHWELA